MSQFNVCVTVNYPEDEKDIPGEDIIGHASLGIYVEQIVTGESEATSFVFIVSKVPA